MEELQEDAEELEVDVVDHRVEEGEDLLAEAEGAGVRLEGFRAAGEEDSREEEVEEGDEVVTDWRLCERRRMCVLECFPIIVCNCFPPFLHSLGK